MKTQIDNYLTTLDTLNIKEDKDSYVERLENAYREHIKKIEKLEKALDKACELIVDNFETCPNDLNKRFEYKGDCSKNCSNNETKECWKEYLLKGSENNE